MLSAYLVEKEAIRRELPHFPTQLWSGCLGGCFSLVQHSPCAQSHSFTSSISIQMVIIVSILQQRQDHRVLPATTSSLFTFTAEFLKEDVCIHCLHVLQLGPISSPETLLKSAVYTAQEKKEVGWHCCSKLLLGPCIGVMSDGKCAVYLCPWSILEHSCGRSSSHCFSVL